MIKITERESLTRSPDGSIQIIHAVTGKFRLDRVTHFFRVRGIDACMLKLTQNAAGWPSGQISWNYCVNEEFYNDYDRKFQISDPTLSRVVFVRESGTGLHTPPSA